MNKYVNVDIVEQFLNDLYMCNNITGFEEREDAFKYYLHVKMLMKECAFVLRKWASNCNELKKMIYEYEQLYFNEVSVEKVFKVLRILWDADVDVLTFDFSKFLWELLLVEVVMKICLKNVIANI